MWRDVAILVTLPSYNILIYKDIFTVTSKMGKKEQHFRVEDDNTDGALREGAQEGTMPPEVRGSGTAQDAERIIEAFVKGGADEAKKACGDAFAGNPSCDDLHEVLLDGVVEASERRRLLDVGFSRGFAARLAAPDVLARRMGLLAERIEGSGDQISQRERIKSINDMAVLASPVAVDILTRVLKDGNKNEAMRIAVAAAFGEVPHLWGGRRPTQKIIPALIGICLEKRESKSLRMESIGSLGHIATYSTSASVALLKIMNDKSEGKEVRIAAVQELVTGSSPWPFVKAKVLPALANILKDRGEDEALRCECATSLGFRADGSRGVSDVLVAASRDPNERVREAASAALEEIRRMR